MQLLNFAPSFYVVTAWCSLAENAAKCTQIIQCVIFYLY